MKVNVSERIYTDAELDNYEEQRIEVRQRYYHERFLKEGNFETFGEWKKRCPNHPLAKMNYPNHYYLQVISEHIKYFNKKYGCEPKKLTKLDF